ncbi:phosphopantetheine-binding protein [Clostridium sp. DJ247]|uniref:phosphopantetheine-binding protein n=1 Tax=Clostridium sp. DJ247 TaxID=2726188 RepID=UPI00162A3B7A|nr:phosphopantetheine-binding protein [Clostridium sp. DJ247]MBC2580393.1 hypothetical protein [Clostridium sp. DJ247]
MNNKLEIKEIIELLKGNIESIKDIEIEGDTPLVNSGLIESFDLIKMLSVFEQKYDIALELENIDFARFATPSSIVSMLNEMMN